MAPGSIASLNGSSWFRPAETHIFIVMILMFRFRGGLKGGLEVTSVTS